MNFFRQSRHDPEHLQRILFECADSMRNELPEYTDLVQPEPMEYARAEISIILLVVSVANACVKAERDPRMQKVFSAACENHFLSLPGRDMLIEWDYYVVDYAETRVVKKIHQEMFPAVPRTWGSASITFDTLIRVLSRVRNDEYMEDTRQAMELSARAGEGKQATLIRVFRTLGEAFTRRVLNPLGAVSDPTGERFRASNRVASKMIGSGWFKTNDLFNRL